MNSKASTHTRLIRSLARWYSHASHTVGLWEMIPSTRARLQMA